MPFSSLPPPLSSPMNIVRFYVLARRIDLYVDKLEGLIDTLRGRTVNEVTKRRARARELAGTRERRQRDGSLIAAVNGRGKRGRGRTDSDRVRGMARGGNWFSVCLFDRSNCQLHLYVDRGAPASGVEGRSSKAPRGKPPINRKASGIDAAARAILAVPRVTGRDHRRGTPEGKKSKIEERKRKERKIEGERGGGGESTAWVHERALSFRYARFDTTLLPDKSFYRLH